MSEAKRRPRVDLWAILGTALVATIVVLVNYISARRYERWDLTRDGLFTLSERTTKLLAELDRPLELYVFMSSSEPQFLELRELIERYRAQSPKIAVEYVDPDREPARFKLLSERFGVRAGLLNSGQTEAELALLAVSGDKRWSVTRDDLVDVDVESLDGQASGGGGAKINVKTEQALSGAIVQVTSGRATQVCVSEGHGEWSLTDSSERSLAALREELKRENITVEAVETRGKQEIPQRCDALFVLGPLKAFAGEESALLEKYLARGGNLLLALDPTIEASSVVESGLEALTARHGIRLDRTVLVELEREQLLTPSPVEAFVVNHFGTHATVRSLSALRAPIVLQLARTIGVTAPAEVVLSASERAYGEGQLAQLTAGDEPKAGEGDVQPPVHVAAGVDTRPEAEGGKKQLGGRLLVIGDSDWLQPELLQQAQLANVDLLASFTGYLTEREALVAIAPRKVDAQALMITEEGLLGIFLRVVLLMPLAALVLGVGVWWQRRA